MLCLPSLFDFISLLDLVLWKKILACSAAKFKLNPRCLNPYWGSDVVNIQNQVYIQCFNCYFCVTIIWAKICIISPITINLWQLGPSWSPAAILSFYSSGQFIEPSNWDYWYYCDLEKESDVSLFPSNWLCWCSTILNIRIDSLSNNSELRAMAITNKLI